MGWFQKTKFKLIPVLPKNYRSICLFALDCANEPNVTMNGGKVTDFSEQGPLTQRTIRQSIDFEIKDGSTAILGFHDHPDQMWINENYRDFAEECARRGWLLIEGPAA